MLPQTHKNTFTSNTESSLPDEVLLKPNSKIKQYKLLSRRLKQKISDLNQENQKLACAYGQVTQILYHDKIGYIREISKKDVTDALAYKGEGFFTASNLGTQMEIVNSLRLLCVNLHNEQATLEMHLKNSFEKLIEVRNEYIRSQYQSDFQIRMPSDLIESFEVECHYLKSTIEETSWRLAGTIQMNQNLSSIIYEHSTGKEYYETCSLRQAKPIPVPPFDPLDLLSQHMRTMYLKKVLKNEQKEVTFHLGIQNMYLQMEKTKRETRATKSGELTYESSE